MPTWILIVALLSIAVTALLASVLRRVNTPPGERKRRDGGDTGPLYADGGGSGGKSRSDPDGSHDGGSDGGGGDGGGD